MPLENSIILIGANYDAHRLDFPEYGNERARHLLARSKKGTDVHVRVMDVGKGTTSLISVVWQNGTSTKKVSPAKKTHEPITARSYDKDGAFKPDQLGVMSITDFYAAIIKVGEAEPGSLVEASIFSHAWHHGPILVNSNDSIRDRQAFGSLGIRDPNDKDGRALKDFYSPNMQASQLALFRGAFSTDGYLWIWGCNSWQAIHQLLTVVARKQPKNLTSGAIELSGLTRELIETISELNSFLNVDPVELKRKYRCRFELRDLRNAMAAIVMGSYPYKVSSVARVRSIGALTATYAVKRSLSDPRQLLEIAKDTRRHAAYFSSNFGIKSDEEGRGYGVFEPTLKLD